jgi:hypothetical protein
MSDDKNNVVNFPNMPEDFTRSLIALSKEYFGNLKPDYTQIEKNLWDQLILSKLHSTMKLQEIIEFANGVIEARRQFFIKN